MFCFEKKNHFLAAKTCFNLHQMKKILLYITIVFVDWLLFLQKTFPCFLQMNVNITQSYYPMLQRQDVMIQNRLPLLCHMFIRWTSSSGLACILICLHLSIIGLFTLSLTSYEGSAFWHHIAQYLFSCGTFGFTGGCVNYLAVTLFFKRIPGLYGSG